VFTLTTDVACTTGVVTLTFATTDALAGVASYELLIDTVSQGMVTSSYILDLTASGEGAYTLKVVASDNAGNTTASNEVIVSVDQSSPVISNVVVEQGGASVLCGNGVAVQGLVDLYVDVVDSGCSPLVVPPTVDVAGLTVSYVDVSGGTYHYQVTVDATTANGAHAITVDAADVLGHASQDTSSALCVDKNQITGTVSFATLTSASYTVIRDVMFKATDVGGVVGTWTVPVSFINDTVTKVATGSYVLTNVPAATTGLSAKTDWTLRQKTGVTLDGNNQATVTFSLSGGDLNGSNTINILDYSALKEDWLTTNARGDINGDGGVQLFDYSLLKSNWFTAGDPE
jgi:hypothetical protein